eukprot:Sspe_Gene.87111::Locus_58029_Transcript_2_5_Confidence_0.588_Length_505::g.87111::m.87111
MIQVAFHRFRFIQTRSDFYQISTRLLEPALVMQHPRFVLSRLSAMDMKVVLGVILVVLTGALMGTLFPIMVSSRDEVELVDGAVELAMGRTMAQVGDSIRSYFSVAYIPVTELFRRFGRDDVSDYGPRLEGALWDLVKSVDNIR